MSAMKSKLAAIVAIWASMVSSAYSAEPITVNLKKLSSAGVAFVPAGTSASTPVDFYVVVKGNVTSAIGVEAQGPSGITATVEAAQVTGDAEKTLKKGSFWKVYVGSTTQKSAAVKRSAVTRSSIPSVNCDVLPESVISAILANLSSNVGRPVSKQEICKSGGTSGSSGEVDLPPGFSDDTVQQPQIDQSYGAAIGFLQKDNCSKTKNYLVRIRVNISKVAPDILASGFQIAARIQEAQYKGGRAASLKPVSDGMYAPRPLLLMQSVGGSQWINLVKWNKKKPKIIKKVSTSSSLVYYRGYVLTRTVADSLLAGGRGQKVNFEATNGNTIYNICGKQARVRWRVNGYPG